MKRSSSAFWAPTSTVAAGAKSAGRPGARLVRLWAALRACSRFLARGRTSPPSTFRKPGGRRAWWAADGLRQRARVLAGQPRGGPLHRGPSGPAGRGSGAAIFPTPDSPGRALRVGTEVGAEVDEADELDVGRLLSRARGRLATFGGVLTSARAMIWPPSLGPECPRVTR